MLNILERLCRHPQMYKHLMHFRSLFRALIGPNPQIEYGILPEMLKQP